MNPPNLTRPACDPDATPQAGGKYTRLSDGSLVPRVEQALESEPLATKANPAAPATATSDKKD